MGWGTIGGENKDRSKKTDTSPKNVVKAKGPRGRARVEGKRIPSGRPFAVGRELIHLEQKEWRERGERGQKGGGKGTKQYALSQEKTRPKWGTVLIQENSAMPGLRTASHLQENATSWVQ